MDPNVPPLSASRLLSIPSTRPGRSLRKQPIDSQLSKPYGDTVLQKSPGTTRIFFQNVKGLTHTSSQDDYRYYMSCLQGLDIDIAGLSETNACWAHAHLRSDFHSAVRRHYPQSKISYGSPSVQVDPCPTSESYQAGGNLTLVTGSLVSRSHGRQLADPTGLGRWSGITLELPQSSKLSLITAYRVCSGSPSTSSLGSSFIREYEFLRQQTPPRLNPRRQFLIDMQQTIHGLQASGHAILLMLDANSCIKTDRQFSEFVQSCGLHDLHSLDPAPSTFIGTADSRIDFMFGCDTVLQHMVRSGTLSYTEGPQSDHRSLFVDLSSEFIRPPKWSTIKSSKQRDLYTGNPELVQRYNESMLEYYNRHQMVNRINDLYDHHEKMSRDEVRKVLSKWDNDQGRAMQHSEKRLQRPRKKCDWSKELRNSAIIRRYWLLRLRETSRNECYTHLFQRWHDRIRLQDPEFTLPFLGQPLLPHEIREHFNRANRLFRKNQRKATPLRLQMYHDLLATYEDDDSPRTRTESNRKARIVRNTIKGETTRQTYANLRLTLKPTPNSSLNKVLVPSSTTTSSSIYQTLQETPPSEIEWESIYERGDIERHIAQYNRASFRAAAESPCGAGIIHDALTYSSLSPEADALLRGEIPPSWHGTDESLREFLASFAIPSRVSDREPIPTAISESDVLRGFKTWKETTSTSPSGRHLGHYKSLVQDPTLLQCFVKFINIAILRGIAIPRWCNATSVMLEKDAGQPRINRLRIIHLFEADLNFFLKIQWGHRLVSRAIELDLLHDSQHGSISQRSTMDPIMLTQLTTDLCRILKHDLARFDNDASACYDRIIVALGMLAARRCGMPPNAIRLHSEALQFMKYTIKTVYGISETNYEGTPFEPLFGTGQGSGASPAVWLTLVVLLLHTLDRLVPDRMNFESISGQTHSRTADAFVDDTSVGFTSSADDEPYENLIARLQNVAQTWEHLLHLSGGKLNLSKCSWYILRWDWCNGRPTLRKALPSDPQLLLSQGNQTGKVPIPQITPETSLKMLGVQLNPLGDFSDHIRTLKVKADEYALRLLSPRINSTDAQIFHRTIYTPSMRYSLAALAMDEEALGSVQTKVIQSTLQKMHFSSKIPTSVRHGPIELGGIGLYDLRTEAGLEALKFFRNALYTNSEPGKLIRMSLEYSQRESGIGSALLQYPGIHLPYLTPSWVMSLRQYLFTHNMQVQVTDIHIDQLQSSTDEYIMNKQHLQRYTDVQQSDINLVRLYLQVTTLADMSDPSSPSKIDLASIDARRPSAFVFNPHWPRQHEPTASQRRIWKRYITSSYLRYIPYWKTSPTSTKALPPKATSKPHTHGTLADHIKTLPKSHRRLLDGLEQVATDPQVFRAFRSRRKLHVASDGGLSDEGATHGWILSTGKHVLFKCSGPVDGPVVTNTSTRSELGGCASALLLLVSLSTNWGMRHRCSFRWYTDSRSAINRINRFARRTSRPRGMPSDVDLISIISTSLRQLRRPFISNWVKAHQDSVAAYESLPLPARLNIDADFLATRYRSHGRLQQTEAVDHQPSQQCSIYINGKPVISQFDANIRFHINGYHLRQYVQQANGWNDQTWDDIDFYNLGTHLKRLSPSHHTQQIKLIHDYLPLGQRRYREAIVKAPTLKLCPCCRIQEESPRHFLQCTANAEIQTSLGQLKTDLHSTEVHPVRYLISQGIIHWTTSPPGTPFSPSLSEYPSKFLPLLSAALAAQESIGWDRALKGFLSRHWTLAAQHSMYTASRDRREGDIRIKSVLKGIHAHTRRLWTARNTALHSEQETVLADIRSQEVAEIRHYYSRPHLLRAADQHYCTRSLSRLLSSSASTRRRWLRLVKRSSAELTKDGTCQSRITSFFPPI